MLAAGFAAFFTGVTEPLEFSFMFVAWPLYVLHAVFTGISLAFAAFMHWTAGFAFSAGFVDFFLKFEKPSRESSNDVGGSRTCLCSNLLLRFPFCNH